MSQITQCPICDLEDAFTIESLNARDAFECSCKRCGRYWITGRIARGRIWEGDSLLPYLSAHTSQESGLGRVPQLTTDNWRQLAEGHKGKSTQEKTRKLLEYFSSRSKHHSDWVTDAPAYDFPLIDAASEEEWHYFVRELLKRGDLEHAPQGHHPPNTYRLTFQAWGKLDRSDSVHGEAGDRSQKLRVFLCHASEDKANVREVCQLLKTDGFSPWLDEEDLLPGQQWSEEIPKAVRNANAVIVFVSQRAVTKEGYFQKEIKFALDLADEKPQGTIFLIPAKLEECTVPDRLSHLQWVDLFRTDGYRRLKTALETRAASQLRLNLGGHKGTAEVPIPPYVRQDLLGIWWSDERDESGRTLRARLLNSSTSPLEHCKAEVLSLCKWSSEKRTFLSGSGHHKVKLATDKCVDPDELSDSSGDFALVTATDDAFRLPGCVMPAPEVTRNVPGIWRAMVEVKVGENQRQRISLCFSWQPKRKPLLQPEECPQPETR